MPEAATADDFGPWEPLSVAEMARLFGSLPVPWWIAGGQALDLFLGRQTRPHHDLDVEILRRDQQVVQRALHGWDLHAAGDGKLRPWQPGAWLPATINNLWCRPSPTAPWAFDLLLADADGDRWRCRRDPRVTRPVREVGRRTADGLPYIAPEVQLLFKAKAARPKDEADFLAVAPRLDPAARRWLADALARLHPGHPWLSRLAAQTTLLPDPVTLHDG